MHYPLFTTSLIAAGIWTLLALLMLILIRLNHNRNPLLNYHLSTATLLALPAGLLAAPFLATFLQTSLAQTELSLLTFGLPQVLLPEILIGADETTSSASGSFTIPDVSTPIAYGMLLLMAGGLLRFLLLFLRTELSLRKTSPVQDVSLLRLLSDAQIKMGITRPVWLLKSSETRIPFTAGLFRPVIVLPKEMAAQSATHETELVLAHELTHIARADWLLHIGELLTRHLFWMHPLVHLLYRRSAYYRELACDQQVLLLHQQHTRTYAELLYSFANCHQEQPVFRAAMAGGYRLPGRIQSLSTLQLNKPATMKQSLLISATILFLFAGLMACSDLTQNADPTAATLNLDDTIEFQGQTITLGELREQIANNRQNLLTLIEENTSDTDPETLQIIQHTADEMGNVLMLIDNGHANRAIAAIESLPPPPPAALNEGDSPDLFTVVEQMPEMIGGQMAFYSALRYPEMARQAGIEGRVILQFIVDEQGNVTNPTVVRSAGAGGLDEAALEALSQVRFKPGMQRGRAVKVQMTQPVVFRFSRSEDTSS